MHILADLKLGPMLIQRHGVSEEANRVRRGLAERQLAWDKAHARDTVPHAYEVHVDVDAKGLFEVGTHGPSLGRIVLVEVVGEVHLGAVVLGQQSDFVQHASETTHGIRAPAKAQEADFVTFAVVLHEEAIGVFDVDTKAGTDSHC